MKRLDHILPDSGTRAWKVQQWFCDERTRSHTCWGWNKDMKGSAAGFVMKGPDHILAEGRIGMWKVQHWILWWKDQITYFLRVEQGWCERFSIEFCDKRTRSHTNWGWNKGVKFSAVGFVMKGPDHILTEGGTRVWNVQQQVLWWKDQITYSLRAEEGSPAHLVMKGQDHLLAKGRTRVWKVQQWVL